MRRLQLVLVAICLFTMITIPSLASAAVDPFSNVCSDQTVSNSSSICQDKNTSQTATSNSIFGPNGVVGKVLQIIVFLTGITSVIMIMLAGFTYITGSGDPNTLSAAKKTILYACIGLVVTVLAQGIVSLVINKL